MFYSNPHAACWNAREEEEEIIHMDLLVRRRMRCGTVRMCIRMPSLTNSNLNQAVGVNAVSRACLGMETEVARRGRPMVPRCGNGR